MILCVLRTVRFVVGVDCQLFVGLCHVTFYAGNLLSHIRLLIFLLAPLCSLPRLLQTVFLFALHGETVSLEVGVTGGGRLDLKRWTLAWQSVGKRRCNQSHCCGEISLGPSTWGSGCSWPGAHILYNLLRNRLKSFTLFLFSSPTWLGVL